MSLDANTVSRWPSECQSPPYSHHHAPLTHWDASHTRYSETPRLTVAQMSISLQHSRHTAWSDLVPAFTSDFSGCSPLAGHAPVTLASCVCTYVYAYMCVHVCTCMCVFACVYVCMCVYVCARTCVCLCVCACVCLLFGQLISCLGALHLPPLAGMSFSLQICMTPSLFSLWW